MAAKLTVIQGERRDTDRAQWNFGRLLAWHLLRGTRPDGKIDRAGRKWSNKAFAEATGLTDRTIRYWLNNQHLPPDTETIERVLFGNRDDHYSDWRLELRHAHSRSWVSTGDNAQSHEQRIKVVRVERTGERAADAHPLRIVEIEPPRPDTPFLDLLNKPTLAILPFQNLTGDPEQEYFVDGMVEEITTAIGRFHWLFVIARASSFTYKGRTVDVRQVGHELGARYILQGSVRKSVRQVRIAGQLIDATTAVTIWSDRFDSALDDIFELQDRVAASVAGAIVPSVRSSEIQRTARKPVASLSAYDLYLRALAQGYQHTQESLHEAVALLRQALTIDPSYATAASLIGHFQWSRRTNGWGALSNDDATDAVRLARYAVEIGHDDPEVLWRAGIVVLMFGGDPVEAASLVDRALALNPNSAWAWSQRGFIYALRNNSEPAIQAFKRSLSLSPLHPGIAHTINGMAFAYLASKNFEKMIEWADRATQLQPRLAPAIRLKIVAYAHLGQLDKARAALAAQMAIDSKFTVSSWCKRVAPSFAPEIIETYATGLRLAGVPEG